MDEPLSNLDAKLRPGDAHRDPPPAPVARPHHVYVTHDQEEALSLADRLVVMQDGVVQQIGTPEELYTQPANWHVARFMGYRNLLELDVERDGATASGQSAARASRLRGTRRQPLTAGARSVAIRPEDLRLGRRAQRRSRRASTSSSTSGASSLVEA